MIAYRALDFRSNFMLKYPDDCFWAACGPQLRQFIDLSVLEEDYEAGVTGAH